VLLLFFYAPIACWTAKNGFPPLRPNKTMLNWLYKNRTICRVMDLFCRIISLENAAKFPFLCHNLSEALILASAHSDVRYLQPRGRVPSSSYSSGILQHLKVLHLWVRVCFVTFELCHLLAPCTLQYLKVDKRLQILISQQLYTQSLYSIHIQYTGYQKRGQL